MLTKLTQIGVAIAVLCAPVWAQQTSSINAGRGPRATPAIPRSTDGKPDFQGIWKVNSRAEYGLEDHGAYEGLLPGRSVVEGGTIPYQAAALEKRDANFAARATLDPLNKCYLPGVPRIMYMDHPFEIFQIPQHIAMLFEWTQVHRLVYMDGKPAKYEGVDSWMGDSRGHWEGDTLVVVVKGQNGKEWLDMAGNFHSDALVVTERYTLLDADTIQYEAALRDAKTYTKPWSIKLQMVRQTQLDRVLEYQCEAVKEEANGLFERDPRTWYRDLGAPPSPEKLTPNMPAPGPLPDVKAGANIRRGADGKPDLSGHYDANAGGANYGLEQHRGDFLTPGTRGVVIDPPDRMLPTQDWARKERVNREEPYRGYDDPTAHCFVAGIPRSMYVPSPFQILQPPGYVIILHERMSWRIIPLDGRPHIPDSIRLWQGDSVGHWEGDILVVDTTNLNGKAWLNEVGEVVTSAEHVIERFIPVSPDRFTYRATVMDPGAYTKPWTIEMQMNRSNDELLEVACLENNQDLQHLKDVRDEYRARQKKEN